MFKGWIINCYLQLLISDKAISNLYWDKLLVVYLLTTLPTVKDMVNNSWSNFNVLPIAFLMFFFTTMSTKEVIGSYS